MIPTQLPNDVLFPKTATKRLNALAAMHYRQTVKEMQSFIEHAKRVKTGISRDKTMTDKLMYIPNDDTQNYLFCRLQLVIVGTFRHLLNQPIKIQ